MNKESVVTYFRQVKDEFKRIHWTSKNELVQMTKIVLGATLLGGLGIYAADLSIQAMVNGVTVVIRWIIG